MKLNTPLWFDNARSLQADRIARSNARQRRLFPWVIAALALLFLFHWLGA